MTDAFFASLAVGGRSAVILFGVMSLLAWLPNRGEATPMERWRRRGWALLSIAVLAGSPLKVAVAFGYVVPGYPMVDCAVPGWAESLSDLAATTAASACLICGLAARGFMRGLSEERVRRGAWVNIAVLIAVVGVTTWLNR